MTKPLENSMIGRAVLFVAFVSTVVLANVVTSNWGLQAAGLGPLVLQVPAGTYLAGLAFGLRDGLQDALSPRGRLRWMVAAIALGAALSYWVADGRIAVASGAAFLLSELMDFAVYSRLRERGWKRAVFASNAAGAVADTLLFLWWAGFALTWESIGGQLLVKAVLMAALYVALRQAWLNWREERRDALSRQRLQPEGA